MVGIAVSDLSCGTTIANLGMREVRFPSPLFEGDTVHVTSEIVSSRISEARPSAGLVEFLRKTYNESDVVVAECVRQALMLRQSV